MKLVYSGQFKKDFKRVKKQGKNISKLKQVIDTLLIPEKLHSRYRDHQLTGKWKEYRDCHIEPDWILIYKLEIDSLILIRTGSHSELFK